MEDAHTPPTEPSGALVPPRKGPGTALATATPPPPRDPGDIVATRRSSFSQFIERTLDIVDRFADNVAAGLGLRQ